MAVASALNDRGITTLLFDLLTPGEEGDRANVFDIPLLWNGGSTRFASLTAGRSSDSFHSGCSARAPGPQALAHLRGSRTLQIVPGATHLFPEPGALEAVIDYAANWFARYLAPSPTRQKQARPAGECFLRE